MCDRLETAFHKVLWPVDRIIRFKEKPWFTTLVQDEPIIAPGIAIHRPDRHGAAAMKQLFASIVQYLPCGRFVPRGIVPKESYAVVTIGGCISPPEGASSKRLTNLVLPHAVRIRRVAFDDVGSHRGDRMDY